MNLIRFLTQNKNARKIFGKAELEIIERQIKGIRLTQSEKNRLSRDIRKKFDFIREASKYSEEFGIKKAADIKIMIEDAKEQIIESKYFPRVNRIVLFGSAAENQLTFRSDIDIAVEFGRITKREATEFRIKILGSCPDKIDIQVYNFLPDKIKKEIDEKGRVLYERKERRIRQYKRAG